MNDYENASPLPEDEPPFVETPGDVPFVRPAEPPRPPGPHIGWALLWFLGFFVFQFMVGIGLAVFLVVLLMIREGPEALRGGAGALFKQDHAMLILFWGATAANVLFAVAVTGIMFRRGFHRRLALRGFHPLHVMMVFLLAPPLLLTAGEIGNLAREVLPHLKLNDEAYGSLAQENWVLVFLVGCILPGIGEEIFFRGFLGRGLVARHGVWLGIVFASLLFGIAHLEPAQAVATAALGLGFHLVFLSTKSIVAPMLAHALNNGVAFGIMKLSSGLEERLPGVADEQHVPWEIALPAAAAAVGLLILLLATRIRWLLPNSEPWSPGYLTAEMPPAELDARPQLTTPPAWALGLAVISYAAFAGVFVWKIMAAT
jgi:hypothetical protein